MYYNTTWWFVSDIYNHLDQAEGPERCWRRRTGRQSTGPPEVLEFRIRVIVTTQ